MLARVKYFLRQLSAFTAPLLLCILLPYWIVSARGEPLFTPSVPLALLGGLVFLAGLVGFILSVRVIIMIGKGTIMPWDPTRRLVIAGPYRYVRNPMILSVILIVGGEALLFASAWLGIIAALFFGINTVYFINLEEPGLEQRFGQEYAEYKKNVPRWVPRRTPWHQG